MEARSSMQRVVCGLTLWAAAPVTSFAEEAKGKKGADPAAMEKAMMAAMEKAGTPGENHKLLQKEVGSWTIEMKAWMGPGEPTVSTGGAEVKSIMEGRYIVEEMSGSMMGKPFTGQGMSGYDNVKQKFVTTWIDSGSTGIGYGEGAADKDGKVTILMKYADVMSGKPATMRVVTRWEGNDKHVSEFFEKKGGKEVKTMEIAYTRKPAKKG